MKSGCIEGISATVASSLAQLSDLDTPMIFQNLTFSIIWNFSKKRVSGVKV